MHAQGCVCERETDRTRHEHLKELLGIGCEKPTYPLLYLDPEGHLRPPSTAC